MKNFVGYTAVLFGCCFYSNASFASFQGDMNNCIDIEQSAKRLDCYDTVAKYYRIQTKSVTQESPQVKNDSTTPPSPDLQAPVVANVIPQVPQTSANEVSQKTPQTKKSDVASFGKAKDNKDALTSIQSKVIGTFKSWKKGMRLKLENGQTWKVISGKNGYKKMNNPSITITTGFFGSFNAKVEGFNAVAKVKRIK